MIRQYNINRIIALLCWSALFVYGCGGQTPTVIDDGKPKRVMESYNLSITNYEGGERRYRFDTPHLTRYEGKDTSYMIFDKGIKIVTYDDSTGVEKSSVISKYAVFRESINQWEARDSVVARDTDGKTLYTDLLFWDQKQKRIYSNIKTRVVDGAETIIGIDGFESDEDLSDIQFHNSRGRILVDTTTNKQTIKVDTASSNTLTKIDTVKHK